MNKRIADLTISDIFPWLWLAALIAIIWLGFG